MMWPCTSASVHHSRRTGIGFGVCLCCPGFDEISTGLDSAATFDIIKVTPPITIINTTTRHETADAVPTLTLWLGQMLRAAVRAFRHTAAISLLQPPPGVVGLFDEVRAAPPHLSPESYLHDIETLRCHVSPIYIEVIMDMTSEPPRYPPRMRHPPAALTCHMPLRCSCCC